MVTAGAGNVIEKWEFAYRLLSEKLEQEGRSAVQEEGHGGAAAAVDDIYANLNRCFSFDDLKPDGIDPENLSEQERAET